MKNIFFMVMAAMVVSLTACTNNAEQTEESVNEPVDCGVVDSTQEFYPAADSTTTAQ